MNPSDGTAQAAPGGDEPNVAGVRVRPGLAVGLYVLLLASAGIALWASRSPEAPRFVLAASPFVFLAFAVGFAAYRIALVVAKRYSAFKAFIQISLAALFFMLLLFPRVEAGPAGGIGAEALGLPVAGLLADPQPTVRALAAEAAGWRHDLSLAHGLVGLLEDPDETVKHAAHAALVRLNGGADLGPAQTPWRERFP